LVRLGWPRLRDGNQGLLLLVGKQHLLANLKKPALVRKNIRIPIREAVVSGQYMCDIPSHTSHTFCAFGDDKWRKFKRGVICYRFSDKQDKEITPLYFNIYR